jgi:hypothetical protein
MASIDASGYAKGAAAMAAGAERLGRGIASLGSSITAADNKAKADQDSLELAHANSQYSIAKLDTAVGAPPSGGSSAGSAAAASDPYSPSEEVDTAPVTGSPAAAGGQPVASPGATPTASSPDVDGSTPTAPQADQSLPQQEVHAPTSYARPLAANPDIEAKTNAFRAQRDQFAQGITDPLVRQKWVLNSEDDVERYRLGLMKQARAGERDKQIAYARANQSAVISRAIETGDEGARAAGIRGQIDVVDALVANKFMTAQQGQAWKSQFRNDYGTAIGLASERKGPDAVNKTISELEQASFNAGHAQPQQQPKDKQSALDDPTKVVALTHQPERTPNAKGYGDTLTGEITLNGNKYKFVNGGGGRGSIPFGEYKIGQYRTAEQRNAQGLKNLGDTFDLSDVADPMAGGNPRSELRIHRASRGGTAGCIGIVGDEETFQRFVKDMKTAGPQTLALAGPGGAAASGGGKDASGGSADGLLGYKVRDKLHPGEDEYFKANPKVAGMAAETGDIILNPYAAKDVNKDAVAKNEAFRLYLRDKKISPDFAITDAQRAAFKGAAYAEDDEALKGTIAARIYSGDPSAKATSEQKDWVTGQQQALAKEEHGKPVKVASADGSFPAPGPSPDSGALPGEKVAQAQPQRHPTIFDAMDPLPREHLLNQLRAARDVQQVKAAKDTSEGYERALIDASAGRGPLPTRESIQNEKAFNGNENIRNTLLKQYDSAAGDVVAIQNTMQRFRDGGQFNPYDKDERKNVDKIYGALGGEDPKQQAAALQSVITKTGIFPDSAAVKIRADLISNDPKRVVAGMTRASNALAGNPNILVKVEGEKDIEDNALKFRTYVDDFGLTAEEAANRLIRDQSPEHKASVNAKIKSEDVDDKIKKNLKINDLSGAFDDSFLGLATNPVAGYSVKARDRVFDQFGQLVKEYYLDTANGDWDMAKKLAANQLKKTWGISEINGNKMLTQYPPEKAPAYQGIENAPALIAQQAQEAIKTETGVDIDRKGIRMSVVPGVTAQQYKAGQPPAYLLSWEDKNGLVHMLNPGKAFVADPKALRDAQTAQREAAITAAVETRATNPMQDIGLEAKGRNAAADTLITSARERTAADVQKMRQRHDGMVY